MARKGVFAEQLDDIDDLMPQPPTRPSGEKTTTEPPPTRTADEEQSGVGTGNEGPESSDAQVAHEMARPRRRRATTSVPTAEVAPQIHRLLRRLTTKERSRDPITARTYAQVVLDAIETYQAELATHWQLVEAAGAESGAGLFSRRPAAPARRRRHADPPARVPLTGLNLADVQVLDQLVTRWNAPSRSALVEQALRLYLNAE